MGDTTRGATMAALAALGALVVHQLAYLAAYPVAAARDAALAGHGHLTAQVTLTAPLAVLAAAGVILHQVRRSPLPIEPQWQSLTGLISVFFVAQESVEGLVTQGDLFSVASNPAIYAGLVLVPLVALLISRVLRRAVELAAWFLTVKPTVIPPARPTFFSTVDTWSQSLRFVGSSPRGPPR